MAKSSVSLNPQLIKQRKLEFAELVGGGLLPKQAGKRVGITTRDTVRAYMNDPIVVAELKRIHEENQQINRMSREKVQDIVLEAIEMGRTLGDPVAIIRGAQELNKMNGFYAPEEKKIHLTTEQRRTITRFDNMTDEDLARMANDGLITEAEFEEIEDACDEEEKTA